MFAKHDLQFGDLIICERPLLLTSRLLDSPFITGVPTFWPPLKNPANREAWESIFWPFFERISKEKQDEYRKLANNHPEDGIGPLLGSYRTNNFELSLDELGDRGNMYSAIYKESSRINHSCSGSNSQTRFDPRSFSMQVRALKDIKAGDEILGSYCGDTGVTIAERQKILACYGFQCTCASCSDPLSDHLYAKILSSDQQLDGSYQTWFKDLTLPDDHIIKPSLLWVSLIEQQGFPFKTIYYHHLDTIVKSFIALGDLENSVKHGMKLARYFVAMTGQEQLMKERADPNYYSRDRSFGTRRSVGKAKRKGKSKGKSARAA